MVPEALVVDAAILLSATLGRSAQIIADVGARRSLLTSDRAVSDSERRLVLGIGRPELLPSLKKIVRGIQVVSTSEFALEIAEAEPYLREAPASGNGSVDDAHLLALAKMAEADIWTHDRLAGTGASSWSTRNLLRALGEEGAL